MTEPDTNGSSNWSGVGNDQGKSTAVSISDKGVFFVNSDDPIAPFFFFSFLVRWLVDYSFQPLLRGRHGSRNRSFIDFRPKSLEIFLACWFSLWSLS